MSTAELTGEVMGTWYHVACPDSPPAAAVAAVTVLTDLDQRWSRFRSDSEISRLNRHLNHPTLVGSPTCAVLAAAIWARSATGGLFDPTVLDAVISAGYVASFEQLDHPPRTTAGPAGSDVTVDERTGLVMAAAPLDLGGIGKGYAADLAASAAIAAGASTAMVSVGGDVAVLGAASAHVVVDHGYGTVTELDVHNFAVATSSVRRRRWECADGTTAHHVIDPRTGESAISPVESATVTAPSAWKAEVLATATIVAGRELDVDPTLWGETTTWVTPTEPERND